MRMLRWICEFTRMDKIKNENTRKKVRVMVIEGKFRETYYDIINIYLGD